MWSATGERVQDEEGQGGEGEENAGKKKSFGLIHLCLVEKVFSTCRQSYSHCGLQGLKGG